MSLALATLIAADIYLSHRVGWIIGMDKIRSLYFIFTALFLFLIGGVATFSNSSNIFGSFIYQVSAVGAGAVLNFILMVTAVDLFFLFFHMPPLVYGGVSLFLSLLITYYGVRHAFRVKLERISIPTEKLQEEVKIMHVSDIHLGHFRGRKFLQKLVDMINEANPDFIVITGDLFDGRSMMVPDTLEPLKEVKVPVYFVDGNHDGYSGVRRIKSMLRDIGVIVLENKKTEVAGIELIGLNHMPADEKSPSMHAGRADKTMKDVLEFMNPDRSKPVVLLHHSPDGIEYANAAGVDLFLAGHTHAGQLFPITLLNELIFKYNSGLSDYKGTRIYVTSGAGTFGPPMRIGTKSEIVSIRLVPVSNA